MQQLVKQNRLVRPLYIPPPYQEAAESGRLILRDGTTATIRIATNQDEEAMKNFFERLSSESRYRRFFTSSPPRREKVETICDSSDPRARLTLVVTRIVQGSERIVATGSYVARDQISAEIALTVDDAFQGRGLGTLLFERLAILATRYGFTRFWAVTLAENQRVIDIFRSSGFSLKEMAEGGYVEVDLSVLPTQESILRTEIRDRLFTHASLRPMFHPRSVAVVGASRDPSSVGYWILEALIMNRFEGPVYPVNPKAKVVGSIHAYPSVRDLPESVDLAVVVVPRNAVLRVVDDCAARGVRGIVVISAGFAETGGEGWELQKKLVEKVRGYGLRMVGPNCLGLMNTDPRVRLNASFSPVFPPTGPVAMSTQSGALGIAILGLARERDLGLSTFVSVGNKADVSGNDLLQYWEEDEKTKVILLYLESFGNPRRFARIARRVSQRKPIISVKAGRTIAGSRAAGSHTAALAASDVAVDALFHQTGVIRAETLDEMFDLAAALSSQPFPVGRRVAIVTNAGGPGILCADACEASNLLVPELSEATRVRLRKFLPPTASVGNPVDMIASATPDQFRRAVEVVLAAGEVDSLVVIFIPVGQADVAATSEAVLEGVALGRKVGGAKKPVLACFMADRTANLRLVRGRERVPCYAFPEQAGRVLGKLAAYAEWRSQPSGMIPDFDCQDTRKARQICLEAASREGGWLSVLESRALLSASGLPLPRGGLGRTEEEAVALATEIGFPVAVKLASHTLVHKTEIGGVHLDLEDQEAVRNAFFKIRASLSKGGRLEAMEGVIVQPMIREGVEVFVGVTQDPLFGPLIAFGLGGIHVEILADVRFRVTPLTDRDAREMVQSIRGYRLLQGYRGHAPADLGAIEEVLLRVSRLVEEVPQIIEIDLNPIFALAPGKGCVVADARIRVKSDRDSSTHSGRPVR